MCDDLFLKTTVIDLTEDERKMDFQLALQTYPIWLQRFKTTTTIRSGTCRPSIVYLLRHFPSINSSADLAHFIPGSRSNIRDTLKVMMDKFKEIELMDSKGSSLFYRLKADSPYYSDPNYDLPNPEDGDVLVMQNNIRSSSTHRQDTMSVDSASTDDSDAMAFGDLGHSQHIEICKTHATWRDELSKQSSEKYSMKYSVFWLLRHYPFCNTLDNLVSVLKYPRRDVMNLLDLLSQVGEIVVDATNHYALPKSSPLWHDPMYEKLPNLISTKSKSSKTTGRSRATESQPPNAKKAKMDDQVSVEPSASSSSHSVAEVGFKVAATATTAASIPAASSTSTTTTTTAKPGRQSRKQILQDKHTHVPAFAHGNIHTGSSSGSQECSMAQARTKFIHAEHVSRYRMLVLPTTLAWLSDVTSALTYLHASGKVHGKLTLEDIMLDKTTLNIRLKVHDEASNTGLEDLALKAAMYDDIMAIGHLVMELLALNNNSTDLIVNELVDESIVKELKAISQKCLSVKKDQILTSPCVTMAEIHYSLQSLMMKGGGDIRRVPWMSHVIIGMLK